MESVGSVLPHLRQADNHTFQGPRPGQVLHHGPKASHFDQGLGRIFELFPTVTDPIGIAPTMDHFDFLTLKHA